MKFIYPVAISCTTDIMVCQFLFFFLEFILRVLNELDHFDFKNAKLANHQDVLNMENKCLLNVNRDFHLIYAKKIILRRKIIYINIKE
jgi:hypothetical protein